MAPYNSGILTTRGGEGGNVEKRPTKVSPLTTARIAAQNAIKADAVANRMTIDQYLTNLLTDSKSQEALLYFIRSRYETPFRNPVKMAMQAALIRFADIATIAKAINVSDDEALIEVENAEYQAIQTNHPDAGILPIELQAALTLVIGELIDKSEKAGVPPKTTGLLGAIKTVTGDNWDAPASNLLRCPAIAYPLANNADGTINLGDFRPDAGSVDTSGVYDGGESDSDGGGGWDWNSIFGTINSAIGVVRNATGAVRDATGAVNGAVNTVGGSLNDQISSIGGNSINKSSLPWIIGGGILLIIVVIIVIYASRR